MMATQKTSDNVRFTRDSDAGLIAMIEQVQALRGDRSLTKTARDLIRERYVQLEERGEIAPVYANRGADTCPSCGAGDVGRSVAGVDAASPGGDPQTSNHCR